MILLYSTTGYSRKYAGEFQELMVGGRICGMGGTGVAQGIDPSALILNPALSPFISRSLHLMHSENFAGIVKNDFGAIIIPKNDFAWGLGFQMVSVGGIKLTTLPDTTHQPDDGNQPIPYDTVSTKDVVIYLNAGRTKNFLSYGTNLKIYYRDLAVVTGLGAGTDIGIKIKLTNLTIGMSIRDFILSPIYWKNETREYIYPKLTFGLASRIPLSKINSILTIESDFMRHFTMDDILLAHGIELAYKNKIYGRFGKTGNRYTAGAGLRYKKIFFDYGLITHTDLGISNKFSLGLEF
ncbi:MAG: hypothetical protein N3A65_01285 [candidate division WOR-3 bacterium]|nr:hypothetical protein [candidate division WOR-3 bacterium]